jgi:hypothetical protein
MSKKDYFSDITYDSHTSSTEDANLYILSGESETDSEEAIGSDSGEAMGSDSEEAIGSDSGEAIGSDSGEAIGSDSGEAIGSDSGEAIGSDSGEAIGSDSGEAMGSDSEEAIGSDSGEAMGSDSGEAMGSDSGEAMGSDSGEAIGSDSGEDVGKPSFEGHKQLTIKTKQKPEQKESYMSTKSERFGTLDHKKKLMEIFIYAVGEAYPDHPEPESLAECTMNNVIYGYSYMSNVDRKIKKVIESLKQIISD